MVDLHCHLIPKLSDGPAEEEVSCRMLRQAAAAGARTIIGVCHYEPGMSEKIDAALPSLQACAAELGIELSGSIEYNFADLFGRRRFKTLAGGSSYILVDFRSSRVPAAALPCFAELEAREIRVVAVHPELLFPAGELPALTKLADQGVVFQLNAPSLLPSARPAAGKMARLMLEKGLVSVIASDAHNCSTRPFRLGEARRVIEKRYGGTAAELLFELNPQRLLDDLPPLPFPPVLSPVEKLRRRVARLLFR